MMNIKNKLLILSLSVMVIMVFFVGCRSTNSGAARGITTGDVLDIKAISGTDISGNTIDGSILAKKGVTMINMWGTFCDPCLREMPHLSEISKEYADEDFQIIGVIVDAADSNGQPTDKLQIAKKVISKFDVNFVNIVPDKMLQKSDLMKIKSIPTTFFVDKNGKLVTDPIVGSKGKEQWLKIINEVLEKIA